jgi:hypothetical protein
MSNATKGFFDGARPGKQAKYGEASFELPILYLRDDFFGLYYTADKKKVSEIIPSDKLTPITLPNGRAVVAIMAYNYLETTIGPYGEVPVAIPVLLEKKQLPLGGFLPLMLQGAYPGFGVLVMHLPVTKVVARDAGRGEWGYTKFVADMDFNITPEFLECKMYEKDQFIFDLRVMRRGFHVPDKNPLITFSVKDRQLIRTVIQINGVMRFCFRTKDSYVKFGTHPMAQSIQALDIAEKPFAQSFYTERAAILPSGEVVDRNVKPLEGYIGETRVGRHTWKYTAD